MLTAGYKGLSKIVEIKSMLLLLLLLLQRELVAYFSSEMDDGEYEEEAADVGGPKKEFCNIVTEATLVCTSPQLFEGDTSCLYIINSSCCKKCLVWSVKHGDIVSCNHG